jgi:distribution and morphology protein 34
MPISPQPYSDNNTSSSGGILEQAWMLKMAQEIARKVHEEKGREAGRDRPFHHPQPQSSKASGMWSTDEEIDAPPAYQA